jgi:DNA (cytosine-5)-methyltransferase 1
LSAQRHGIEPVWASEIEPFPIKVTQHHFPNMKHLGDITKINGTEIEPVDIITFGSPCQDLSVAGKREGLQGERSGLFMDAVRIIREMRRASGGECPRFIVWENVPGAFSSNKGEDFRAVLSEIAETKIPMPRSGKWANAGMVRTERIDIAWRTLDAQYWGVPQRRRRIFLVADFTGQCAGEILFKPEGLRGHSAESGEAREGIAADAERGVRETSDCLTPWDVQSRRIHKASGKWPALYGGEGGGHGYAAIPEKLEPITVDFGRTADRITINPKVSVTLQGEGGGCGAKTGLYCIQGSMIGRADKNGPQGDGINEDVSFTLNTTDRHAVAYGIDQQGGKGQANYGVDVMPPLCSDSHGTPHAVAYNAVATMDCRNLCENEELSGTIQAKENGGYSLNYQNPVRVGYAVRRLTPLECERLMGFPDGWTDIPGASDTARYKSLGNSVAIPCVDFVMSRIAEVLRTK